MHKTAIERAALKKEVEDVMALHLPVAAKEQIATKVLVRANGLTTVTSRVIIPSAATGEGSAAIGA